MSSTIKVKPGDLNSRMLKKAISSLKKANSALMSYSYMRSYDNLADVYYTCYGTTKRLFSNATTDMLPADLQYEVDELERLAGILGTGPDGFDEIDRSFRKDIKSWRRSGKHNKVLWTSSGGATNGITNIKGNNQYQESDVIINEKPDYQHQWKGDNIIPPKENKQGHRSAEAYREVMEGLDVEHNIRYQEAYNPYWGYASTCCNVYVWDVLTAMDCQIPSTDYFGCGAMRDWMASPEGARAGWVEVDQATAIEMANNGYPTVAADTSGAHVAMVAPQKTGDSGVYISQAGWKNFNYDTQSMGWDGSYTIRYFYHK